MKRENKLDKKQKKDKICLKTYLLKIMASNISPKKFKSWMLKNEWDFLNKNKHEIWVYKVANPSEKRTLIINFHRGKGQGIAEDALKEVADVMKIKKSELIQSINNNKKK